MLCVRGAGSPSEVENKSSVTPCGSFGSLRRPRSSESPNGFADRSGIIGCVLGDTTLWPPCRPPPAVLFEIPSWWNCLRSKEVSDGPDALVEGLEGVLSANIGRRRLESLTVDCLAVRNELFRDVESSFSESSLSGSSFSEPS